MSDDLPVRYIPSETDVAVYDRLDESVSKYANLWYASKEYNHQAIFNGCLVNLDVRAFLVKKELYWSRMDDQAIMCLHYSEVAAKCSNTRTAFLDMFDHDCHL